MESMKKSDILKLEDKDLQLRYFLGGLKLINDGKEQLCNYWTCDLNCSCMPILNDNNYNEVKKFIKRHYLTKRKIFTFNIQLFKGRNYEI